MREIRLPCISEAVVSAMNCSNTYGKEIVRSRATVGEILLDKYKAL